VSSYCDHHAMTRPPRIGIGGPVGSGKTMLCLKLCESLRDRTSICAATVRFCSAT
jgi:urease accessory protein